MDQQGRLSASQPIRGCALVALAQFSRFSFRFRLHFHRARRQRVCFLPFQSSFLQQFLVPVCAPRDVFAAFLVRHEPFVAHPTSKFPLASVVGPVAVEPSPRRETPGAEFAPPDGSIAFTPWWWWFFLWSFFHSGHDQFWWFFRSDQFCWFSHSDQFWWFFRSDRFWWFFRSDLFWWFFR